MKNKIWLLLLSFMLLGMPAVAKQSKAVNWAALEQQVQAKPLFNLIQSSLFEYYNKTDFSSLEWKRVSDVLSFLEKNQASLQSATIHFGQSSIPVSQLLSSGEKKDQNLLWSYLGARYLFDKFGKEFANITFSLCSDQNCYANGADNSIILGDIYQTNHIGFFNIGIHEATHLLLYEDGRLLSEIATCTAQNQWALPVKLANHQQIIFSGVRDFRLSLQRLGSMSWYLNKEYNECIIAPLYADQAFHIPVNYKSGHTFCDIIEDAFPDTACEACVFSGTDIDLLSRFFGKSIFAAAQKAKEGRLVHAGTYSYKDVIDFFTLYYQQEHKIWENVLSADEVTEKVNQDLEILKKELGEDAAQYAYEYEFYLYRVDGEVVALISSSELPLRKIMRSLQTTLKNEKIEHFYEVLLNRYAEHGFNCSKILPEAGNLLDQLAGPQTRSVVPEGYI